MKRNVIAVIVVSKGKSLTWLDDCRIPYSSDSDKDNATPWTYDGLLKYRQGNEKQGYDKLKKIPDISEREVNQKGRFPANLLVSDDILNDGKITRNYRPNCDNKNYSGINSGLLDHGKYGKFGDKHPFNAPHDSGSYSRYFDLDKWYEVNKHKVKKKLVRPVLC